ncbi:MAG: alpha/beta hydrolase [Magnetococcales bacterium]|nr:alpha/beta hydrolase [Magnetococcales bacterium]
MPAPLLLLVHGWGVGPGLWHGLRRALPEYPCHSLDLGFFGKPRLHIPPHQPLLAVGHSLGFLWLLHHLPQAEWRDRCVGLVSIAGFSRFSRAADCPQGVPLRLLERMARRLPEDAGGVLRAFGQQGGTPLPPHPLPVDPAPLLQGLHWLRAWDGRAALAAWEGPLYSLAARDDAIVPPALTAHCFATTRWLERGGHLLPLSQVEACAAQIRAALSPGSEAPP